MVLLLAAAGAYLFYQQRTSAPLGDDTNLGEKNKKPSDNNKACPAIVAEGRFADYSEKNLQVGEDCPAYSETILFFHAPWCPECRGFEKAIARDDIPAGVQILKVDYDSSTDLKKKYGVTIQSTFVSVDSDGNKLKLWSGYGKSKSVDAILEST